MSMKNLLVVLSSLVRFDLSGAFCFFQVAIHSHTERLYPGTLINGFSSNGFIREE